MSARPAAVVVLAAGEGTRMRSATPKVLHAIGGRSLLQHAVEAAAGLDPEHLVVVVGHGRELVEAVLSDISPRAVAAVQEEQRGTGHAVQCALAALPPLSGTVVVTYGDTPLLETATLRELVRIHEAAAAGATVLTARPPDPSGYGRILRDDAGELVGIVEHRDAGATQLAIGEVNSGVYAFAVGALAAALARLTADNVQGELYLTDVLGLIRAAGRPLAALPVADAWQTEGVNDRVQLARLGAELNRRLLDRAMRSGVTVVDPSSVWLDVDVSLEPDVVLEPGVQLRGATSVAAGATVGPDSTLHDCAVGPRATVVRTHAAGARIGEGATVGPWSYLRPGTVLGPGAKVGAYVEVKASTIGADSKVPHLSYVGDAEIGEGANIGAATVFVNYDGVAKHRTRVGDHARVGSDTMLVAPVNVGDGAYTAAGSVITQDVPAGAMAVARGRQRNVEGWVQRRRPGSPAAQAAARADALGQDGTDEGRAR